MKFLSKKNNKNSPSLEGKVVSKNFQLSSHDEFIIFYCYAQKIRLADLKPYISLSILLYLNEKSQ